MDAPEGIISSGDAEAPNHVVQANVNKASSRWMMAGNQVKAGLKLSDGFSTLRDQYDVNIVKPGQLKVLKRLGTGAFAVVDKCEYTPTDVSGGPITVAVKRLKPEILRDPTELESFLTECSLMRKLKHSYVVKYYGVGKDDESSPERARQSIFLVQEFMGGGTLKQLVTGCMRGKSLYSNKDALTWSVQIAQALAYLHSSIPIVIHRDLKMENILLSNDKTEAKLADFGLAAFTKHLNPATAFASFSPDTSTAQQDQAYDEAAVRMRSVLRGPSAVLPRLKSLPSTRYNPTGLVVSDQLTGATGTLMYMAPEMFQKEAYDFKVDVFSFGIILYELFSRYLTVYAISVEGTAEELDKYVRRVANGYRPPLDETWPESFRSLLRDCWSQKAAQRPDMHEVVHRLQALQQEGFPEFAAASGCGCCMMM